jgi:hypothetical protein
MARFYSTGPQCQTDLGGFAETVAEKCAGVSHIGQAKLLPCRVTVILNLRISKGKSIHEEKVENHARKD